LHESNASDSIYAHFWFVLFGALLMTIIGCAAVLAALVTFWGRTLVRAIGGPPR